MGALKSYKQKVKRLILSLALALTGLTAAWFLLWPWPETAQPRWFFYDRTGEILYQEPAQISDAGARNPWLEEALIVLEDQHFYRHVGVDPLAVLRAFGQNWREGEVVSGASTLTMQLARLRFLSGETRNLWYKVRQSLYALKLEWWFSKPEILRQYLQRLNLGQGQFGLQAAAHYYFGKTVDQLSKGEAVALLATIPNPSRFNPVSDPVRAKQRQQLVFDRLHQAGLLTSEEYDYWRSRSPQLQPSSLPSITAPHWVFGLKQQLSAEPWAQHAPQIHVHTTLDKAQYQDALRVVRQTLQRLGPDKKITNAAVVVLDGNNQVRVLLGSPDFFDPHIDGMVNMATARRLSGSVLKPFLYALALEEGWSPLAGVRDLRTVFADGYLPRNFKIEEENGVVRFREALANSYNIAAVDLLQQVGLETFYQFLATLGISLEQDAAHYGLSIILGSAETSLLSLTQAYATFTHQGQWQAAQSVLRVEDQDGRLLYTPPAASARQVLSPATAEWGQHVLSDTSARWKNFARGNALELPFAAGAKTGTSQDFRDNWVLGFSPHYTVGVWVGNADGTPMQASSGLQGAGPVWQGIMQSLHADQGTTDFTYQSDRQVQTVCRRPGEVACSEQVVAFVRPEALKSEPRRSAPAAALEIYYPGDGDVFLAGSEVLLQWRGAERSALEFWLDDQFVDGPIMTDLAVGSHRLVIRTPQGESDSVKIEVQAGG